MNSPSGKRRGVVRADRKDSDVSRTLAAVLDAAARPLAALVLVALAAAILANSMMKEVSRDEQMYCTAGVLLAGGQSIYKDFSYPSQLPCHPLLLAALYKGLGTTHYLLVGRLVSAVSDILILILIVAIYRAVFRDKPALGLLLGLAAAVLDVFNPLVDYAAGYAWNHDVVILCVVLAVWMILTTGFQGRSPWRRIALAAILLTLATCMRVTTSLVEATLFAAVVWIAEGPLRNRLRAALPFLAGGLITALWPLWVIVRSPGAFRLNLVRIPSLYGRWLHEIGMTFDKAALTIDAARTPGYLILLILAVGSAWVGFRYRSHLNRQETRWAIVLAILPLVFLVIAYIPPTMWPQYLAMPVPFIAIALAYPLLALSRGNASGRGMRVGAVILSGAALLCIVVYPVALYRAIFVSVPDRWEPIRVHRLSQRLAMEVEEPRLALTLGPLYALEGDCDIYPELACGSIVYRIADRLTPEERRITHTVGPATLAEMVKDRPFDAVLTGAERDRFADLEKPLLQLVPPEWPRHSEDTLHLCLRP
ncbi:MAG: hypothetical protein GX448_10630 [Planctomycetes bacterium]|nr:hypothetical protein [Planctomycetota bacterium]